MNAAAPAVAGRRIAGIDMLRGLVIVLMALDHVRDYMFEGGLHVNPLDPAQTTPWLYITRWVTHLCAPTFVFLAGVSAYLQLAKGKETPRLSRFLLTRGLWLIVLELTILGFGWSFAFPPLIFLQVIWAIGWAMVVLAALVWLPRAVVLAVGIAIIAGHNLLDPITPEQLGSFGILWQVLHEGGILANAHGPYGFIPYAILPWTGIIALGYGMGGLFTAEPEVRDRKLLLLGLAMLAAFFVLRGFGLYGNPSQAANLGPFGEMRAWQDQPDPVSALMAFLDVQKYPPSLQFTLVTLGVVFAIWPLLSRLRGPVANVLLIFGAVPLFFYVLHVYLVHLLAIAANALAGNDVGGLFDYLVKALTGSPELDGLGFPLAGVYAGWAVVLAVLYPFCRWWVSVKKARRDWWLSYL